ncbi:MAG: T9SS type A sorting domain-containing protein [Ignavibacteria bacterium]|nr:MAG: T9SS type A sorting domain-containing protein [Ignavibacteria bacterium]
MIQATNPFVNLPFSAWDVSDTASPRQLTLAWRDQDNDATWDPSVGDDGLELVFVLYRTYDPTGTQFALPPAAIQDQVTKSDVMYGLSLDIVAGHSLNESVGTLSIVPDKHLGPADVYTFSTQRATASNDLAKSDIQKINVFPNPYYGFNAAETDRLQKYVTFNHLPQRATIRIFNLGGVLVRTLDKDDATQFVRWNLRNETNLPVASGIYVVFIQLQSPINETKTLKLALVQEEQILRIY